MDSIKSSIGKNINTEFKDILTNKSLKGIMLNPNKIKYIGNHTGLLLNKNPNEVLYGFCQIIILEIKINKLLSKQRILNPNTRFIITFSLLKFLINSNIVNVNIKEINSEINNCF
jgi:hypothetical protein